jgi:RNA polymerase sigma factor (sigma-70 family)
MLSTEMNDWSLLREYVERGSEAAFESLVRRHLDMVYSTAWRQTSDACLAEEVAQAVFILLARKARELRGSVIVAGWLYRAACLTARRALRDQTRRRLKETEAAQMKSTDSNDEVWTRLMPYLDHALANLGEEDRMAIVLRFLERQSFQDVSSALRISEDAAKKRVIRALEKLHVAFTRQGLTLGLGAITAALSAKAVVGAPSDLLTSVVQAGLTHGMAAGPTVAALVAEIADVLPRGLPDDTAQSATGVLQESARFVRVPRLSLGGALIGATLLVILIGAFNWLPPKPARPAADNSLTPTDSAAVPSALVHSARKQLALSGARAAGSAMALHVVADENDQPLTDVPICVEFTIIPQSVLASFVTDAGGTAQIVLPTESVDGMTFWVSAHGRVPTATSWGKQSIASLAPDYTLRLPRGKLVGGTVIDEAGQPVAGATVHLQSEGMAWNSREFADYQGPSSLSKTDRLAPVVSDGKGRWSADFFSPKAKSVFGYVENPAYATTQFGHVEPPDPIEPSTNINLVLKQGSAVTGVVQDGAGNAIQNAYIGLRDPLGLPFRSVTTDAAGRFEFPRVEFDGREISLGVGANGFQPVQELQVRGGQATRLEIVLKPVAVDGNSVIRGRVTTEDGRPISGVMVGVAPGQLGLEEIHWGTDTDVDGRFAWASAPEHPVKVMIRSSVPDWEERQVELAPDGTEPVITLKPKAKIHVHGTVWDSSTGTPVPEFKVLWAPGNKQGYVVNTSVLIDGRDGTFAVDMLPEMVRSFRPPGSSTRLDFQANGYVNKVVLLASATNDIELTVGLEPAVDIAGIVLCPDGTPAEGAKVSFRMEHFHSTFWNDCFVAKLSQDYPFAVETRAGAKGVFRIPKIDGVERLDVVHPEGWASVPLNNSSMGVIQLKPWGRIQGVLESAQAVMPDIEVRASQAQTNREQIWFELAAKTGTDGRFEFRQVPGGRALLSVNSKRGNIGIDPQEIQVEPGQAATLTLTSKAQ